jgi:hypothetical protein
VTSAELVIFAIHAGLRLYGAARKAYVDAAQSHALVLPLPRAPGEADLATIRRWFKVTCPQFMGESERIACLVKVPSPTSDEEAELRSLYDHFYAIANPETSDPRAQAEGASTEELYALLEIRQWSLSEGREQRTALQQVAGTLVNVAVDYFANVPGALSEHRPQGRALREYLMVIDNVDFAGTPVQTLAGELMVALLDGVVQTPELAVIGDKEAGFVREVAAGLSSSLKSAMVGSTSLERRNAGDWVRTIATTLIRSGAQTVLANPARYFDVGGAAEAALVNDFGKTLATLVIGSEGIPLQRLLSAEGLDAIVRTGLQAVAQRPELIRTESAYLNGLLVALATDLTARAQLVSPDLFPQIAGRVLAYTGQHLDTLWQQDGKDPAKHLVILALREVLDGVEKAFTGEPWQPRFSNDAVLALTDLLMAELKENPRWLNASDTTRSYLTTVVTATLDTLKTRRVLLDSDSMIAMLASGIRAAGQEMPLLEKLPPGGRDAGRIALNAALDAILDPIVASGADSEAHWRLARRSVITALVETGLDRLAKKGGSQQNIDVLRSEIGQLVDGQSRFEEFAARLERSLKPV